MKLSAYLKDRLILIAAVAAALVFIYIFLDSMLVGAQAIVYICIVLGIALFAGLAFDFHRKNRYYSTVISDLEKLDRKYLLYQMTGEPDFVEGRILKRIMDETQRSMNGEITAYRKITEEYKEYVELWVHEIKTPIACASLICENNPGEAASSVKEELLKIEKYVEQSLYFARSADAEKDYIVKETDLKKCVLSALKKNSSLLIENGAAIETDVSGVVYTDEKWLSFIFAQIIVNAVKYKSADPLIRIYSVKNDESIALYFEDNGIGIPKKDISRIFDKSFTGENGRKYPSSTGMGLYLCKKLCGKLGLDISAESGDKTTFCVNFPKGTMHIFG